MDLRDNMAALSGAVEDLRRSVIKVVRTSTADVERRQFRRFAVDLPGELSIAGGRGVPGSRSAICRKVARMCVVRRRVRPMAHGDAADRRRRGRLAVRRARGRGRRGPCRVPARRGCGRSVAGIAVAAGDARGGLGFGRTRHPLRVSLPRSRGRVAMTHRLMRFGVGVLWVVTQRNRGPSCNTGW